MSNHGNYIVSLANLCRWLASQAEALGVEIYPGFPAHDLIIENDTVKGVSPAIWAWPRTAITSPTISRAWNCAANTPCSPRARAVRCQRFWVARFGLHEGREPQKFGIGLKELWEVDPGQAPERAWWCTVSAGRLPTTPAAGCLCITGASAIAPSALSCISITATPISIRSRNFSAPRPIPPFANCSKGARRIGYGARAITEGGFQSVPKLAFPGGALIGCAAGFVNLPRIKGSHNAIRTGMMAAKAVFDAVGAGRARDTLSAYEAAYAESAVARDLRLVRNAKPLWSRLGTLLALPFIGLDLWTNQLFEFLLFRHPRARQAGLRDPEKSERFQAPSPIPSQTAA